jgi:hypothetical protein
VEIQTAPLPSIETTCPQCYSVQSTWPIEREANESTPFGRRISYNLVDYDRNPDGIHA